MVPGRTNADIKAMPARIRLLAVALRVEPLACIHRLAPAGGHPTRNTIRPTASAE